MLPTLNHGDIILVQRRFSRLRPGHMVTANHPELGAIVKRITSMTRHGVSLAGDNVSVSTPETVIGILDRGQISGKVILKISPRSGLHWLG